MAQISMYDEFKEIGKRLQDLDKHKIKREPINCPAMIVLEHKESGENEHAMVGDLENILRLYDWGLNVIAEQYQVSFKTVLDLVNKFHESVDEHAFISNEKRNLETEDFDKEA